MNEKNIIIKQNEKGQVHELYPITNDANVKTPINNAQDNLKKISNIGCRNLLSIDNIYGHGCAFYKLNDKYRDIPTFKVKVDKPNLGNNFGFRLNNPIYTNGKDVTFTLKFYYKIINFDDAIKRDITCYTRVFYSDNSKEEFNYGGELLKDKIIPGFDKSQWNKWLKLEHTFTTSKEKDLDRINEIYFYTDFALKDSEMICTFPMLTIGSNPMDYNFSDNDIENLINSGLYYFGKDEPKFTKVWLCEV